MSQQVTLVGHNLSVETGPGGSRFLIAQEAKPPSGNLVIIPMPKEIAEEIGKKLAAPSVETSSPGELRAITGGLG